jgi:hypothetical protein
MLHRLHRLDRWFYRPDRCSENQGLTTCSKYEWFSSTAVDPPINKTTYYE